MKDPKNFYTTQITKHSETLKKKKYKETFLIISKLFFFGYGIWSLYTGNYFIASVMVIHFLVTIRIHERVIKERKTLEALQKNCQMELASLEHKFPFPHKGEEYIDPEHPYTSDMDIFGYHSLFHLINRCVTKLGRDTLASWLKAAAPREKVLKRQEAIEELIKKSHFRQNIAIQETLHPKRGTGTEEEMNQFINHSDFVKNSKLLIFLIHAIPSITLLAFLSIFIGFNYIWFIILFTIQLFINLPLGKKVRNFSQISEKVISSIPLYNAISELIEKEEFNSLALKKIKKHLTLEGTSAYKEIKKLSNFTQKMELRRSTLHPFLNNILFWDLNNIYRVEKWLHRFGKELPQWLHHCGEVEALCSFGSSGFNNPQWVFPKISEEKYLLKTRNMGHPLIKSSNRICNDFTIQDEGKVMIITGPNMAGKSTFLRTVGINSVMALGGAKIAATEMEVSKFQIRSSMKISDSLDRGISLFYAELKRLKEITDAAKKGERVFFLIDEMLKGTNVIDRRKGSIALTNQLLELNVSGLIATHDLSLAELPDPNIANTHFDSIVEGEELEFDYKLKEGVCKSFNALILMKKIGISGLED